MQRERYDILVSGAGIAGLVAAAGFARAGRTVCIVDPATPAKTAEADGSDLRSTAYLQPARSLFEQTGLWPQLADRATPLRRLAIHDSSGWPPMLRDTRTFDARDLGLDCFGWNLPNWLTRSLLADYLAGQPGVSLRLGTGFAAMTTRDATALVRLDDGSRIEARLVIGADGRGSPVREAAGIDTQIRRYGQKALATVMCHDAPHDGVSHEVYNSGGAFTTVPLPNHEGQPASAIVWMNDGRRALDLAAASTAEFDHEASLRAMRVLGSMRRVAPVRVWPVVTQTAARMTGQRTALIAEAAHVLPPIGAQGLNTSLQDVAALLAVSSSDPGAPETLAAYEARRHGDVATRARAIDLFNRICKSENAAVHDLRLAGLRAAHDLPPLRLGLMRAGLGPSPTP